MRGIGSARAWPLAQWAWLGLGCFAGLFACAEDSRCDEKDCGGSGASGAHGGTGNQGGSAGSDAQARGGSAGLSGTGARAGAGSGGVGATSGSAATTAGSAGRALGGQGGSSGSSGAGGTPAAGTGGPDGGGEGGDENGAGATSGGSGSTGGNGGGNAGTLDVFGIRQLYPSAVSGAAWNSAHWAGEAYSLSGRSDARDPLGLSGMRGTGTLEVTGAGELVMSGSQPRIYIYEPEARPWQNLEITVYYQRVEDEDTAYAGLVIGARSGPEGHTDSTACDAHTYYARVRNDGAIDFEKELEHPASSTQSRVQPATAWPPDGQVPRATWIGFKFVIYNQGANSVKLEAYRDMTSGADGGSWEKVNETTDAGGWFVETSCAEHSPEAGESDRVVLEGGTTFIRNTDVAEARYRWLTIREIAAP
jgi:hypothetical protein